MKGITSRSHVADICTQNESSSCQRYARGRSTCSYWHPFLYCAVFDVLLTDDGQGQLSELMLPVGALHQEYGLRKELEAGFLEEAWACRDGLALPT